MSPPTNPRVSWQAPKQQRSILSQEDQKEEVVAADVTATITDLAQERTMTVRTNR